MSTAEERSGNIPINTAEPLLSDPRIAGSSTGPEKQVFKTEQIRISTYSDAVHNEGSLL